MSARTERWIYVGVCVVLYALAMALLTWAIREPTRWIVDTLNASVGTGWALVVIVAPPFALVAWTAWRDRHLPPVEFTPPKGPRWARWVGNAYLALLGISLVIVFAAIFRAS